MKSFFDNDIDRDVPSGTGMASEVAPTPRTHRPRQSRAHSKGVDETAYYGRSVYMLNRCLDDIEKYFKQLSRHLKQLSSKTEDSSDSPPTQDEAIDAIQKIKFSFNINDEVKLLVPEATYKVFLRLLKFVRLLDDLCRRQVIPGYDSNMVSDVIEPLLTESTIMSLDEQLPPNLFEFWQELGPAWNTPAEKWPNSLTTYMPQFTETLDKEQTLKRWSKTFHNQSKSRSGRLLDERSVLTMETPYGFASYTKAPLLDLEQRQYFLNAQEQGRKLCYTTVLHVSKNSTELHAMKGEVFEILDSDDDNWWLVKTHTGTTGQLPRWKLREFDLSRDGFTSDQDETLDDSQQPRTPASHRYPRMTGRYMESTSDSDVRPNGIFQSPVALRRPLEQGQQVSSLNVAGTQRSPGQQRYQSYHQHTYQTPQRYPSYMTLTDKSDTFRRPATLSRLYNHQSQYPFGSGTLTMPAASPRALCSCGGAANNFECAHPHPHTCSCEITQLSMTDTLPVGSVTYLGGGTIARSNTFQPYYPVMSRILSHQPRSVSMDSVDKSNELASSLERFNSRTPVYYKPTMTLERKKRSSPRK